MRFVISVSNEAIELVCVPSSPVIKSIYPYKLVIDVSCAVSFAWIAVISTLIVPIYVFWFVSEVFKLATSVSNAAILLPVPVVISPVIRSI